MCFLSLIYTLFTIESSAHVLSSEQKLSEKLNVSSASSKTNIMSLYNRRSDLNIEDKSDDEFNDSFGIFQILSAFKYWRTVYRKFRSEIKFVYCITDHFLKIDYIMDSITTPRFYNSSNHQDLSKESTEISQQRDFTSSNSENCSGSTNSLNDQVGALNKHYLRSLKSDLPELSTNATKCKKAEDINEYAKNDIGRSLVDLPYANSNIVKQLLFTTGNLIYVKRWIEDFMDSFGVFHCIRHYLWILFLRWIDT